MGLISRKLSRFLLMFLSGFTSVSVLLLFLLLITFFVVMHSFWFISANIDKVLLINPSAIVFVFGDFDVHYEDWLTYSSGTGRPGELWISNDLIQIFNFPTWIPDCDSHSPVFSIWKLLGVLQKACIRLRPVLPIFSYTYTLLFCCKVKSCCDCCFTQ